MVVAVMLRCNKRVCTSTVVCPVAPPQATKPGTGTHDHDAHRHPQERQVQRQQQQAGNQHPEAKHRQDSEQSAQHQQQPDRNPQPPRGRLAQPAKAASRPTRKQSLPAIEVEIQSPLVSVCHGYTVPRPRSPARERLAAMPAARTTRPTGLTTCRIQRKPALIFASVAAPGQSCLSPSVLNATGAVSRCACRSGAPGSTYNNPVTISPRAWAACR